jgi:hypothetical protein
MESAPWDCKWLRGLREFCSRVSHRCPCEGRISECPTSHSKARSLDQTHSKMGLLRRAFRATIFHPVNRNGDHRRLCHARTHRHCAMDSLATAHVPSDPMGATTQPRRFK